MSETKLGALYYPFHPTDGLWLRHALLYHDYVATTIPRVMMEDPDYGTPKHLKICEDEGLYKIASDSIQGGHVAIAHEVAKVDGAFAFAGVPMAEDVALSFMLNPGFSAHDSSRNESFRFVDVLADVVAELSPDILVPSTDLERSFQHLVYGERKSGSQATGLYLSLWNVFPSPGMDVDIKSVVKFRLKRSDELLRLRVEMMKMREVLGKADSPDTLKQALHSVQTSVGSAVADLRSALGSDLKSALATTVKELVTTQPAAMGGIAAVVGGAAAKTADAPIEYVIGGAVVAAITGIQAALFRTLGGRRRLLRQNPYAYVYLAEKAGLTA